METLHLTPTFAPNPSGFGFTAMIVCDGIVVSVGFEATPADAQAWLEQTMEMIEEEGDLHACAKDMYERGRMQ